MHFRLSSKFTKMYICQIAKMYQQSIEFRTEIINLITDTTHDSGNIQDETKVGLPTILLAKTSCISDSCIPYAQLLSVT